METRLLYRPGLWEAIANHPDYDLGRRELVALTRLLPTMAAHVPQALDVLHLASSTGREVSVIVSALPSIGNYLLSDIVPEVVERSWQELQVRFPHIRFVPAVADIELSGTIAELCKRLSLPTLLILAANSVIFSNRQMDSNIQEAMGKDDLFLLTVEEPHDRMLISYLTPPVFELLSQSGHAVNAGTVEIWRDNQTGNMHMACEGEDLLVSYKPTMEQLRRRMAAGGFMEVAAERYADLHMLAGLYRRK